MLLSTLPCVRSSSLFSVFCTQSLEGCTCNASSFSQTPDALAESPCQPRFCEETYTTTSDSVWAPINDSQWIIGTSIARSSADSCPASCAVKKGKSTGLKAMSLHCWISCLDKGLPERAVRMLVGFVLPPRGRWQQCCPHCQPGHREQRLRCVAGWHSGRPSAPGGEPGRQPVISNLS